MDSIDDRNRPFVSVLIPLACLKAIDETVNSLINQKYSADEIIILRNDIKELPEGIEFVEISNTVHSFREVFIQKRGKGNALNIGISLSSGELICVLDADCVLDNKALFNIICHFDDENVMAAGARLEAIQKTGKLLERVRNYEYIRTFLVKTASRNITFTFMEILIQIPVFIARLWGMISFPWRRLVW